MLAAGLQLLKGGVEGFGLYQQSRQVRYNARTLEQDMRVRRDNMIQVRQANARREAQLSSAKTASLVNQFAVSGIEFSGDAANYVAQVAATDELNQQQLNQDAYYAARVMDVERRNMKTQAEYLERSMRISAVTSLVGAGFNASTMASEQSNYWESFGPQQNQTPAGMTGGINLSQR